MGKAAVARWDLRQKELKAQQKHQEQLLQQQVAPSSIEEEDEDQRISFGHHGFPDVGYVFTVAHFFVGICHIR